MENWILILTSLQRHLPNLCSVIGVDLIKSRMSCTLYKSHPRNIRNFLTHRMIVHLWGWHDAQTYVPFINKKGNFNFFCRKLFLNTLIFTWLILRSGSFTQAVIRSFCKSANPCLSFAPTEELVEMEHVFIIMGNEVSKFWTPISRLNFELRI